MTKFLKNLYKLFLIKTPFFIILSYIKNFLPNYKTKQKCKKIEIKIYQNFKSINESDKWFCNNLNYLSNNLRNKENINHILEIGSYEGRSAIFFLKFFSNSKITCVDTWSGSDEHTNYNFNMIEENFDNKSCLFEYRNSVFKKKLRNKFFITSVDFKLNKKENYNLTYKDLKDLDEDKLTLKLLREKIIEIRNSKLPNPKEIGNAGSFFKNPIVEIHTINKIKIDYDDLVYFEGNEGFKIPAAWLIEKSGWKGYKKENIGISDKHALVLVNYGAKSGEKLKQLSIKIMEDVKNKFGIKLEPEVNII